MARQGLNGTMTYTDGTATYTYQVRIGQIGYGVDMIFGEDQGRTQRSFYPHRTANQQFSVQVLLKNWDERSDFVSWMVSYAQFALDPTAVRATFPFMQVLCPVRNFSQQGMPLSGYEWGAHTGMMAFSPVFVFEAATSPGQNSTALTVSTVTGTTTAYASDPAIQYFYPFSTQLAAGDVPQDYGQVVPSSTSAAGAAAISALGTSTSLTTVPGSAPTAVPGVSSPAALAAAAPTAAQFPAPGFTASETSALVSAIKAG